MTFPFSCPSLATLEEHEFEAIQKLLSVMSAATLMGYVKAREALGPKNFNYRLVALENVTLASLAEGIRAIQAKRQ